MTNKGFSDRLEKRYIGLIASIIARYSDAPNGSVKISYRLLPSEEWNDVPVKSADEELISSLRI